MTNWKRLIFFLFFPVFFHAEQQALEVVLATKQKLLPIYLSQFYNKQSSLQSPYLEKIYTILHFDLHYNGSSQIVKKNKEKEVFLGYSDPKICFDTKIWSEKDYFLVIKSYVEKKNLFVEVFNTQTKQIRKLHAITLSGDLAVDRKKIHQLADSIQQIYFGKIGIASLQILYSVRTPNPQSSDFKWISEIWISDYDGHNAKKLTNEKHYAVHPLFLKKENERPKAFMYVSYKKGQPKIYVRSLNTDEQSRPILPLRGNQILPALTLRCDKLAFISDAAGKPDLFLQHFDEEGRRRGKPLQIFSSDRATQASPSFSPDGTKIAFVSDKDGPPRIYVMQLPKRPQRNKPYAHLITKKNRQNVTPSWSPDGTKIAFSAKTGRERQIWIYDFILDEEIQLTYGPMNKENPSWAPDSLHLMYNTEDEKTADLFLINVNQKKPVKISEGLEKKRFPSWEMR